MNRIFQYSAAGASAALASVGSSGVRDKKCSGTHGPDAGDKGNSGSGNGSTGTPSKSGAIEGGVYGVQCKLIINRSVERLEWWCD